MINFLGWFFFGFGVLVIVACLAAVVFEIVIKILNKRKFAVADHFKADMSDGATVKICFIDYSFGRWFFNKIEATRYAAVPRCHHDHGNTASLNRDIIASLNGKAETTLAGIFKLLRLQGNGENGILLTNGHVNLFYVRDADKVLRAVSLKWYDGGWNIYADPAEYPYGWLARTRVFSR